MLRATKIPDVFLGGCHFDTLIFPQGEERIMSSENGYPVEFLGLFTVKDGQAQSIRDALNEFLDKLPTVDRESYPSKCGVLLSMLGMMAGRIAELQAEIKEMN
jgi:hypothetical protein